MPELTAWDYGLALIALVSIGFGLWRGLIRTVFALAGWIIALVAVPSLGPIAADSMALNENAWVAYIVVFLVALIGTRMVGGLLARGAKSAGLAGVDRLLGGGLGVARALLILTVLVVAAKAGGLNQSAAWKSSFSRPLLDQTLKFIEPYLPEKLSGIKQT